MNDKEKKAAFERVGRRITELFIDGTPPNSAGECPFCSASEVGARHDEGCDMPAAMKATRGRP